MGLLMGRRAADEPLREFRTIDDLGKEDVQTLQRLHWAMTRHRAARPDPPADEPAVDGRRPQNEVPRIGAAMQRLQRPASGQPPAAAAGTETIPRVEVVEGFAYGAYIDLSLERTRELHAALQGRVCDASSEQGEGEGKRQERQGDGSND